jgi:uncharacterized protein YbjT (DUF2867 family)
MKIVIFGASGMVGHGVLLECLDDARVSSVLVVGRSSCGVRHAKLTELLHQDFFDYAPIASSFTGVGACFFALGVSSAGMDEAKYTRLTYDLTMAAANALFAASPGLTFCYVSGKGTDSSESGRVMWARVKGRTENAVLARGFGRAFAFRPAAIEPLRGVRSKTPWVNTFLTYFGWLFPLIRAAAPGYVTTTVSVGRAMLAVAFGADSPAFVESREITRLAETPAAWGRSSSTG